MAASNAKTSAATESAENELVVTRLFDAPRELVFECWIEPEHLQHWQGAPRGFTVASRGVGYSAGRLLSGLHAFARRASTTGSRAAIARS